MPLPPEAADKLATAVAAQGLDLDHMFGSLGFRRDEPLRYAELCALYEEAARATGDPDLGLHIGEHTRAEMYGLLGYSALHSATLGDALARLVTLQGVWTDEVMLELRQERRGVALRYLARTDVEPAARAQESEQMMAAVMAFARTSAGADLGALEVRFEHKARGRSAEHKRIFGGRIVFRAPMTAILFADEMLARPIARADIMLGTVLRQQAEQSIAARPRPALLVERARAPVAAAIAAGRVPSLAEVARGLACGPRTLQRRLAAEGTSWRALRQEVRIALARELLADPGVGLAQIAFLTGFSQASAFNRAFRRAVGTTPRAYRIGILAVQERR